MAELRKRKPRTAEQPPWEDLPPLCWDAVVRRLVSVSDLQSVSLVCKQLLNISNTVRTSLSIPNQLTPRLDSLLSRRFTSLTSIDLSSFRGDPSTVLLQIARYPLTLDRLDLSNRDTLRLDGLREVGSKFGALRVLVLSNVGSLRDADLVTITECFPALEELDISYRKQLDIIFPRWRRVNRRSVRVTDDSVSFLSRTLRRLSRIDLSGNVSVSDQSLEVLSVNCLSLREVGFRGCGLITGRGIALLIVNRPELVSLTLSDMKGNVIFCEELVDSFRHARGLSSLDFSGSFIWDALLMSVAEANIPLKSIVLSHASGFSFNRVLEVVHKHRGIQVLDLKAVDFLTDRDMNVISKDLRNLISVDISHCTNLLETTLCDLMRQCPFLKDIRMEGMDSSFDDANETDVWVNSQVRSLRIRADMNLTDECLDKIGRRCPNLQHLDVGLCLKITGDGISGVLKSCPEIRYLDIRGLKNIRNLCINFELPQLESLKAGDLKLNNEQLAAFISRCCHLKYLDLPHCAFLSTEGVEKVVKNCKVLREINLRDCHIVRDDVPFLSWMVSVRPSLRRIVPPCRLVSSEIKDFFLQHGLSCL